MLRCLSVRSLTVGERLVGHGRTVLDLALSDCIHGLCIFAYPLESVQRGQVAPGLFAGHVDEERALELGRGKDGQKNERLVTIVVRSVDQVDGDVGRVAGAEGLVVVLDPLRGLAGDHVDNLFDGRRLDFPADDN